MQNTGENTLQTAWITTLNSYKGLTIHYVSQVLPPFDFLCKIGDFEIPQLV